LPSSSNEEELSDGDVRGLEEAPIAYNKAAAAKEDFKQKASGGVSEGNWCVHGQSAGVVQ
jgi:hypothetical protein